MASATTPTLQDIVSDDLNYEIWAPIVKAKLVEKELWDVVKNGIPPRPSKIPELSATIQAEELSKWKYFAGKDTKALQIIQSYLPNSVFRNTLEVASAKDLWDMLNKSNEEAKLMKGFEQIRIEEGERISESNLLPLSVDAISGFLGITKLVIAMSDSYYGAGIMPVMDELVVLENLTFIYLRELLDTFESVPVEVGYPSDDEFVTRMLILMSDSHYGAGKPWVTEEELVDPQILTFNDFRELLDMFESTPVETINVILKGFEVTPSSKSEDDFSLITKEGDSMKSRRKRGECFQCGERGHFARDCRGIKNQQSTPLGQVEKEKETKNELPEYQMLAFDVGPKTYDKDMWMIYSTTSNHMTPYEKYFTTLDRSHKARIKFVFGDGVMSEGIGDVVLMTDKGKKTIKNVLFVPKIDRNVLSVGQMT